MTLRWYGRSLARLGREPHAAAGDGRSADHQADAGEGIDEYVVGVALGEVPQSRTHLKEPPRVYSHLRFLRDCVP